MNDAREISPPSLIAVAFVVNVGAVVGTLITIVGGAGSSLPPQPTATHAISTTSPRIKAEAARVYIDFPHRGDKVAPYRAPVTRYWGKGSGGVHFASKLGLTFNHD
jgi:hypothetical protein